MKLISDALTTALDCLRHLSTDDWVDIASWTVVLFLVVKLGRRLDIENRP